MEWNEDLTKKVVETIRKKNIERDIWRDKALANLQKPFWFRPEGLYIRLPDQTINSITFDVSKGANSLEMLRMFLNSLILKPEVERQWLKVDLSFEDIAKNLSGKVKADVTRPWIRFTIGNVKQKIKARNLQHYLSFSNYKKAFGGYSFSVNCIVLPEIFSLIHPTPK